MAYPLRWISTPLAIRLSVREISIWNTAEIQDFSGYQTNPRRVF